jgi:tetratricopeptide (TPR) repeat protein
LEDNLIVENKDDNLLNQAKSDFAEAYKILRNKDYKKSLELFSKIEKKYRDSADYRVEDVCNRSKALIRVADAHINVINVEPETEEEILLEVVYNINACKPERAAEYLAKIEKKISDKAYALYLRSLISNLEDNRDEALAYLRQSVEADGYYKIVAYNDPDYAYLLENEEFLEIVQ